MSNRAWVTLATNDSYGLGALVLAHSLRRINSAYPAVILVTPSVTEAMRNRLSAVFAEVITVDVLDSRDATHLALLQRPELGITFTKIHCWNLTQFEKCVFLDADTLVVQNCDELFERQELSAAPDVGWPDCFNSGVFVFVPSSDTYTRLISFAQERGSFDGGDQGLLNAFFSDWAHGDINKHLPFLYNVTSAAFYSYLPALKHYGQNLKIIHFIGTTKPWLQRYNWESRSVDAPEHLRELLQQWWDIFVGHVHSNLDSTMEPTETNVENSEEEAPLEVPPQDLQNHYEAKVDPLSEFPWHHPEVQITEQKNEGQTVDTSRFYDPWANYKGSFSINADHSNYKYENRSQNKQFNFTWINQHQNQSLEQSNQCHYHTEKSPQQGPDKNQYPDQTRQYHHYAEHYPQQYDYIKENEKNLQHNDGQSQKKISQNYQEHYNKDTKPDFQYHQRHQEQSQYSLSQNEHKHHHGHTKTDFQYYQHDHSNHTQSDYQSLNHTIHHEPVYSQIHRQQKEGQDRDENNYASQNGNAKNLYYEQEPVYMDRPRIQKLYYLHWDNMKRRKRRPRKMNRIRIMNEKQLVTNDHISDTDSEDDFRPRHPYDGFYLRHRATIDSRGRKVCTHEIPPTPSPSPEEDDPDAQAEFLPTPGEDEEYLTASECEDQSGVAGNLARVVPGTAGSQSEAVDELTRRQGWEAGNIDYMGADSFTNIWAKISQTLNQAPAKEPSPPRKEPSPPKQESPLIEQPQPEVPKPAEAPIQEAAPAPVAPVESKVIEPILPAQIAASVVAPLAAELAQTSGPIQSEAPKPAEEPVKAQTVSDVVSVPETQKEKTKPIVPPTPPATPKSTSEASTPVTETAPKLDVPVADQPIAPAEVPKAVEASKAAEVPQAAEAAIVAESPQATETPVVAEAAKVPAAAAPASPEVSTPAVPEAAKTETTPVKLDSSAATTMSTDSPPLANTPSKEDAPTSPAAKLEERRKPVEKLQLCPPAVADPLPTPDSEAEDAATLAQSIIASELKVTSPSPSSEPKSPQLPQEDKKLNVQKPELPTPPVSLAQIGVKPKAKPTTAAQIESSVLGKTEASEPAPATPGTPTSTSAAPTTPTTPTTSSETSTPTEVLSKKKVVKKVIKKEGGDASTPVPPPRKKEKKPKDK